MSTVRVVNIQHTDATEPNIVLEADGTTVFASGITISGGTNLTVSGTAEFASGTVSAPSITFIDDNNTGIYEPAADTVAITTAATERLRVDSSGNLGIGTTSVDFNDFGSNTGGVAIEDIGVSNTGLKIGEGSNDNYLIAAGNGSFYQSHYGSGSMIFGVGNGTGAEQMRIDSSGRLLVGTPSAETRFGFTPKLQVEGTGVDAGIALARYSNDNTGPVLIFSKSRGTSVGDNTSVIENSVLGAVYFAGADGTDQSSTGASIIAQVDGTPGSNDMPGRLTFSTTADGASSPTERMRIDSSGNLLVNTTSVGTNNFSIYSPLQVQAGSDGYALGIKNRSPQDDYSYISFGSANGNEQLANIFCEKTATNTANLYFATNNGNASTNSRIAINADGLLRLISTPGIDFSGIQTNASGMTSETLDSYEEGTFTPLLLFGGTNTGMNLSHVEGVYTKIGRVVHCFVRITVGTLGTSTGVAEISALPFAVGDVMTTTAVQGAATIGFVSGTNAHTSIHIHPWESTTRAKIYRKTSSTSDPAQATNGFFSNNFDCRMQFTYMVA